MFCRHYHYLSQIYFACRILLILESVVEDFHQVHFNPLAKYVAVLIVSRNPFVPALCLVISAIQESIYESAKKHWDVPIAA